MGHLSMASRLMWTLVSLLLALSSLLSGVGSRNVYRNNQHHWLLPRRKEQQLLLSRNNTNLTGRPHVPKYMLDFFYEMQKPNSTPPGEVVRSFRVNVLGVERVLRVLVLLPDSREEELIQRHVYSKRSCWETLDVTRALFQWSHHPHQKQRLRLEVSMSFATVGSGGELDLGLVPGGDFEPLLLVYSTPRDHRRVDEEEVEEMMSHVVQKKSRRPRRSIMDVNEDYDEEEVGTTNAIKVTSGKKKKFKNVCRRKPLYVDFAEIHYDSWIIAPPGYEAFECTGKCFYPLGDHLSPTKHAIVRTLLHTVAPKKAARACCVPTRLEPISILYLGQDGVVTYKYHYEDMVVAECGCR